MISSHWALMNGLVTLNTGDDSKLRLFRVNVCPQLRHVLFTLLCDFQGQDIKAQLRLEKHPVWGSGGNIPAICRLCGSFCLIWPEMIYQNLDVCLWLFKKIFNRLQGTMQVEGACIIHVLQNIFWSSHKVSHSLRQSHKITFCWMLAR